MTPLLSKWSDTPVFALEWSKSADVPLKLGFIESSWSDWSDKMSKTKTKNENKTEKALAAEKELFNKQQVSVGWIVLSKAIKNSLSLIKLAQ